MFRDSNRLRKLVMCCFPSNRRSKIVAGIIKTMRLNMSTNAPSRLRTLLPNCSHLTRPQSRKFICPYPVHGNQLSSSIPSVDKEPEEVQIPTTDVLNYGHFEEHLFHILSNTDGMVPTSRLLKAFRNAGLWSTDRRIADTMSMLRKYLSSEIRKYDTGGNEVLLNEEQFRDCIRNNIFLIKRAFTGEFVIPEFTKFCSIIDGMYNSCRTISEGTVASYIPQLAKYSPDYWGVSLCTIDGQRHSIGDVHIPFTLQSASKPFNYALAINELGADVIHKFVGHEPSGESFNFIKLGHDNKPHNPLINAGAILIASLIQKEMKLADRFDYLQNQYRKINGGEYLGFNNAIFLSEKETANRNFALGYYMKENNCFPPGSSLEETLDFYFQMCSIEVNANSAAVMAATLANGGFCPITDEEVLSSTSVRNTLALMHSCGMYDYSGGFAFRVGLPAKSSVSGAIILVIPNVMGMCLWSPPLDHIGNSVRGVRMCEQLVEGFNFHHYDNLQHTKQKFDPRIRNPDHAGNRVVNLLFGAYNGDFKIIRRMALIGQDMSVADYDGRTALHLAAAEGHLDCVKFLVEKCRVPPNPRDRWGHTPADDAKQFNRVFVQQFLEEFEQNGIQQRLP